MEARTDLEQAVRHSLTGAAADVRPTGADLAGRAIRVGRWRRVWRGAGGALAIVAATMVASGVLMHQPEPAVHRQLGVGLVAPTPHPDPTVPEPPSAVARPIPGMDGAGWIATGATGDGLVLSVDGQADIDLPQVGDVVSAHRAGDGWVLVTGGDHPRLHWVSEQEPSKVVLRGLDTLAVAGERVAWRRGTTLGSATISATGALEQRSTVELVGPTREPVGFVGEAVLLRTLTSAGAGAGTGTLGLWRPGHDSEPRSVTAPVTAVFGALPGGQTAVGLVPEAGRQCLALLDVARELAPDQAVCPPTVPEAGSPASLSPDGRWLLGSHRPSGGGGGAAEPDGPGHAPGPVVIDGPAGAAGDLATVLVDVRALFAGAPAAVAEVEGVPAPLGRAVWPDHGSVYYPAAGGVVYLRPDLWMAGREGAVQILAHPGDPVVLVELA